MSYSVHTSSSASSRAPTSGYNFLHAGFPSEAWQTVRWPVWGKLLCCIFVKIHWLRTWVPIIWPGKTELAKILLSNVSQNGCLTVVTSEVVPFFWLRKACTSFFPSAELALNHLCNKQATFLALQYLIRDGTWLFGCNAILVQCHYCPSLGTKCSSYIFTFWLDLMLDNVLQVLSLDHLDQQK